MPAERPVPVASGLDWAAAYARLEDVRRALDPIGRPSRDGAEREAAELAIEARLLAERATALARPAEAVSTAPTVDILVFTLAGRRFGLDVDMLEEVIPIRDVMHVPWTPGFIAGVINHRGRLLSVLGLAALLGLADEETPATDRIVVVATNEARFGLEIGGDTVVRRFATDDLGAAPEIGRPAAFILHVTPDMVFLIDLPMLIGDRRILINDEAG